MIDERWFHPFGVGFVGSTWLGKHYVVINYRTFGFIDRTVEALKFVSKSTKKFDICGVSREEYLSDAFSTRRYANSGLRQPTPTKEPQRVRAFLLVLLGSHRSHQKHQKYRYCHRHGL
jgi:hypothetical protein